MTRLSQLWRTTTVRLTALFILFFAIFAVLLLGLISWQSSIQIQRQQADSINRELMLLQRTDNQQGLRALVQAVDRLARRPGPGIYYLGDAAGLMVVGNATGIPVDVLEAPGVYAFAYQRERAFEGDVGADRGGNAVVRSIVLANGMRLVVGRDVVERQGFTAIILQTFLIGAAGILLLSAVAGGLTAMRVLNRIEAINATASKIMSGSLSERVQVTRRNDEFDGLATNLNAMLDRIEQLMVGLKDVSDNVAHDLKTPLTRLRNRAEAALRNGDDDVRQAALEATISESDQLIRTFNALLMIARAEAGTPSGAFSEIDLSAVADDIADLYGPVAEEAGAVLKVDVEDGIRLTGNRELIGQALVNLVENAIKYGKPADGAPLAIGLDVRTEAGRVLIEVSDNGPGIAEEDRPRVVERFVRLERSRTEPGSGLGLSLVAAVARLHRGELRLEDNNPGLKAIIDLPA